MINRILIRMKVVQMLYSYLLTRSDFNILPAYSGIFRDRRFAYTLYSDLLITLLDQSGFKILNFEGTPRFELVNRKSDSMFNRIGLALSANDGMKKIALDNKSFYEAIQPIRLELQAEIKNSSLYKDMTKKKESVEIRDEVAFWKTIFHTVVLRNAKFLAIVHSMKDFTHMGYDLAVDMFDTTLDDFASIRGALIDSRKSLAVSLDKSYELYHSLLQLMVDLTKLREQQLDEAKHKYLPSYDDLNPNTRFVDNEFIKALEANETRQAYLDNTPISWKDDDVTLRKLLDKIMQSETYQDYMNAPATDFKTDCDLWYNLFRNVIVESEELAAALESQSIFWNDDVVIMGSFVLKTIKSFAVSHGKSVTLSPKYKDIEDEKFGPALFEAAIRNQDEYRSHIDACLVNSRWDPDRLAFMDIVILETAIAELLNFESIPSVVTVNEYTEIANYYSTPKSGQFVTGMLYAIIKNLREAGLLVKE